MYDTCSCIRNYTCPKQDGITFFTHTRTCSYVGNYTCPNPNSITFFLLPRSLKLNNNVRHAFAITHIVIVLQSESLLNTNCIFTYLY